jgi:hypothetical protein
MIGGVLDSFPLDILYRGQSPLVSVSKCQGEGAGEGGNMSLGEGETNLLTLPCRGGSVLEIKLYRSWVVLGN